MAVESFIGKRIKVGSDGFVELIDFMGCDASIADAARISYGKGTKTVNDDIHLIRYLYRHAHCTPFEMCEIKLHLRIQMDAWRQMVRHRSANVNEYSTRYSQVIDEKATTAPDAWRKQSTDNKQGSSGYVVDWPEETDDNSMQFALFGLPIERTETAGGYLSRREKGLHEHAHQVYHERLAFGVAREQARKDIPLSTYTEVIWKCDLRNLMNFLSLRMDSHAQLEIREYANAIYEIAKSLWPVAISAFDDYDHRRGGMLLSMLDLKVMKYLVEAYDLPTSYNQFLESVKHSLVGWPDAPDKRSRERDECYQKLRQLNMVQEK